MLTDEEWADLLDRLLIDQGWWGNRANYCHLIEAPSDGLKRWLDQRIGERIHPTAIIDSSAVLDESVVVDMGAIIYSGVVIQGPAYIGRDAEIGPNCFLTEGTVVSERSCVGAGAELKSSILLPGSKLYHFCYVGHSIVGCNANIAAGVITSVRRFDGEKAEFRFDGDSVIRMPKAGALIGDNTQVGIGTSIFPGRQIQPNSRIPPASRLSKNVTSGIAAGGASPTYIEPRELWAELLKHWDSETNRFWARNNVFLVLNGALVALLSKSNLPEIFIIVAAILGMVTGLIWYRINVIGKYYMDRWKEPIHQIEIGWPISPVTLIDAIGDRHPTSMRYQSSSTYMQWIVVLAVIGWMTLFIFYSYGPVHDWLVGPGQTIWHNITTWIMTHGRALHAKTAVSRP